MSEKKYDSYHKGRARELERQNRILVKERSILQDRVRNSYSHSKSVSYGTIMKLLFACFALLGFISVGRVLLYPGQELPTFETLLDLLRYSDTLTIKQVTFLGEFRLVVVDLLENLPFIGAEAAEVIAEPFIWLFLPYEIIYFVIANLWNLFNYVCLLFVWVTGIDIFGVSSDMASSIINVFSAMSGVFL